jgi:hypothetical protein
MRWKAGLALHVKHEGIGLAIAQSRGKDMAIPTKQGSGKMEILIVLAFVVFWFVLQAWILPRFGVST